MGINRIPGGLGSVGGTGDHEPLPPKAATPAFVPTTMDTGAATKLGDQQLYGDYRRIMAEALWARRTQEVQRTEAAQQPASAQQTGEFREVTVDQMRGVMSHRWQARKPRMTPKMSPQIREKLMQRYERRQTAIDAKLTDYTRRLNDTMRRFEINTPLKQAMFLATIAEESVEMRVGTEQPSKYASSRATYKGRGLIQLTHETNYREASEYLGKGDLIVKQPALAATKEYMFDTAGWFWSVKQSGQYQESPNSRIGDEPRADLMDFREAAGLVNGGQRDRLLIHWGTRLEYYKKALEAFEIPVSEEMQKSLDEQIKSYQGKNHIRHPEQSWWDSPAGKKDPLRKKYGIK
ncbi:MAG: hypothetical protein H0W76_16040 [Pyrinomonadaceae bacterium]|nr:hypothetical protein [Pyrinomonadaceae bacterium]